MNLELTLKFLLIFLGNLFFTIFIFELLLRLFKKVKSLPLFIVSRTVVVVVYAGLLFLSYYSTFYFMPEITENLLKFFVFIWAFLILVYVHKCFSPRAETNFKKNIKVKR